MSFVSSPSPAAGQTVFVRKTGNDITGDGSYLYPYLTVAKALSSITDNSLTKYYKVDIGPGRYDETAVALKPHVWLVGQGGQEIGGACRINVTTAPNLVTVDPSFNATSSGNRGGVSNIYFRGSTGLSADLVGTGSSLPCIIEFNHVTFNGTVTYKAANNGDGLDWRGGETFGSVTLSGGGSNNLEDVLAFSNLTISDCASATQGFQSFGSVVGGNVTITNSCGQTSQVAFVGTNIAGTFTQTQTNGTLTTYVDAISYPGGALTVNSGTFVRSTSATALGFTPTTSGNWNTAPKTVQAALDELASRVKALSG